MGDINQKKTRQKRLDRTEREKTGKNGKNGEKRNDQADEEIGTGLMLYDVPWPAAERVQFTLAEREPCFNKLSASRV